MFWKRETGAARKAPARPDGVNNAEATRRANGLNSPLPASPGSALAAIPESAEQPVPERAWSAKVFEHIEWRRFEAVCEGLFTQSGMRAETQSHGADGG